MTTFLNRFNNSDTQRVQVDSAFAGTPVYHDGLVYGAVDVLVVNYAGTLAQYKAGIGQTAAGELMVFDASAGLPSDTFWQSGLPISAAEHRLCVDPTNAVVNVHDGVPFTTVGAVAVDGGGGEPPPGAFTFTGVTVFDEGEPIAARITWTAAADAVTYNVYRDLVLVHTVAAPGDSPWTDNSMYYAGGGGTFSYTMTAVNAGGTTNSSSNPQSVDVFTRPGVPPAPTAVAGDTQATVTCYPSVLDGGDPINFYVVAANPFDAPSVFGAGPVFVYPGLTNGVSYTFHCNASNDYGQSTASPESNAVTPTAGGGGAYEQESNTDQYQQEGNTDVYIRE